MATPTAASATSPPLHTPPKSSHKRVFKSISRFLSGGGSATKQRPKLPHLQSSGSRDGAIPLTTTTSARRSRSRSSSRSRHTSDDEVHEGEHRLADPEGQHNRGTSLSALSAISGADTEASMYAMSPSTRAPSSIVSARTVDSSSHASSLAPTHASTHKSYASTKPTTLLSVDLGGGAGAGAGANRIAVVSGTGAGHGSQSFSSALPNTSPVSLTTALPSGPFAAALHHPTHRPRASTSSTSSSLSLSYHLADALDLPDSPTGVPSHTHAHPRNNPLPGLPPADNASVLTLASSSFAPSVVGSGDRSGGGGGGGGARNSWTSAAGGGLRAWSTRQARSLGGGGGGGSAGGSGGKSLLGAPGGEADEDASVRALAGSRRASEESLGARSTWSAVDGLGSSVGAGRAPREGSVRSRGAVIVNDGAEARDDDREVKERRGSMRTVETAPSILLPDPDGDGGGGGDGRGAEGTQAAGDGGKGNAVHPGEHAGVAPALAATTATIELPPGGDALAPPIGSAGAAEGNTGGEWLSPEVSTPTKDKDDTLDGVGQAGPGGQVH